MAQSRQSDSSGKSGTRTSDVSAGGSSARGRGKEKTQGAGAKSGATDLKDQTQQIAGEAQDQAQHLVGMAKEQAQSRIAAQKDQAADTLSTVGSALHDASSQMRQQNNGNVADYIDTAANQVEHLAGALRGQDIGEILNSIEQFGRRQPTLFLAASFALGFAGARFLKSSSQPQGRQSGAGYQPSYGRWDQYGARGYGSGEFGARGYGAPDFGAGEFGTGTSSSLGAEGFGYGETMGRGSQTGFAGASREGSRRDWTSGAGFDTGPEGQ
jgi:hypothetical protein